MIELEDKQNIYRVLHADATLNALLGYAGTGDTRIHKDLLRTRDEANAVTSYYPCILIQEAVSRRNDNRDWSGEVVLTSLSQLLEDDPTNPNGNILYRALQIIQPARWSTTHGRVLSIQLTGTLSQGYDQSRNVSYRGQSLFIHKSFDL